MIDHCFDTFLTRAAHKAGPGTTVTRDEWQCDCGWYGPVLEVRIDCGVMPCWRDWQHVVQCPECGAREEDGYLCHSCGIAETLDRIRPLDHRADLVRDITRGQRA